MFGESVSKTTALFRDITTLRRQKDKFIPSFEQTSQKLSPSYNV